MQDPHERIRSLPIWADGGLIRDLPGGISNINYDVESRLGRFVVRFTEDDPVHHIKREAEILASQAAHASGLSPSVVIGEVGKPGVFAVDYIDAQPMTPERLEDETLLDRVIACVQRLHKDTAAHLRGKTPGFWVFHINRDYIARLTELGSPRVSRFERYLEINAEIERAGGPYDIVFCHNDLMPGNILDDGDRLWLIDWEYGGFNTPLFDLGNFVSNNRLGQEEEKHVVERYFCGAVDTDLWRRYLAVTAGSNLREALWSLVAERYSPVDFDYAAYADEFFGRFEEKYERFKALT